ncbi:hypothetical protein [Polyangium sp. 6x1]|uniref:hypothetical protein n=1 Tax=Polyangium sp. 6x1 TaxID=3042689 RepID=UPI0024829EA4|nr:hypothetical protein [Polyangium sp. 6x1]MDI1442498.1 hypothetical protein [Polyangium sp. 6x1]
MSKHDKLQAAEESVDRQCSNEQSAWGVTQTCKPIKPIHLGIWFRLEQYPVEGRTTSLALGVFHVPPHPKNVETFHKKTTSGPYKPHPIVKILPEPLSLFEIYGIGESASAAGRFELGLSTISSLERSEEGLGYRAQLWSSDSAFNNNLGCGLAVHVNRTHTFTPRIGASSEFRYSDLERSTGPLATEKFGTNVHTYVKMKLNGTLGIYPIVDGVIVPLVLPPQEYESAKLITKAQYTDAECTAMPLIPGVHQVHILIEESGGYFYVSEVHCDGDRIYP